MATNWKTKRLQDCATWFSGGTPKKSNSAFWDGEIPWISAKSLTDFFVFDSDDKVTEAAIGYGTRMVPKNSILFVVRGMSLKTEFRVGITTRAVSFNQDVKALVPIEGIEPDFLAYAIKAKSPEILSLVEEAGHGTGVLPTTLIQSLEIAVPSLTTQKTIGQFFRALDRKIELNRQMNTTLEAMAQALFKSWFVDFDPVIDNALLTGNPIPEPLQARAEMRKALGEQRKLLPAEIQRQFPSRFVFTEAMGWVPEGWRNMRADEVASISIGKTPPRKESQWFSDVTADSLVWVSIRDMGNSGVFIGDSSEYLTTESVQKFNVKIVPKDSVILSFKLTLGRVAIADTELTTNEAIAHFVSPRFGLNKEYLYLYLRSFDYGNLGSTSSIATAINSKIIKSMPVLVPNAGALKAFEEVARFWFSSICENISQTETLTKLRETLLPKLLSGQLRIPDAEAIVEQVAAG